MIALISLIRSHSMSTDNPRNDDSIVMPQTSIELTEREKLIAQEAAKLAVQMVMDQFYKDVGKGIIHKFLVIIGAAAVGFAVAKGWYVVK